MKTFVTYAYTFSPGAAGVGSVNLSGISGFDARRLVAIIDQTHGAVIYAAGTPGLGYTGVVGTTITLSTDTSAYSSSDALQVIYDDPAAIAVYQSGTFTVGLPANAAQEAGGNLASLNTKVTTTANGIKVDSSGVTQPVSGTVAVSTLPSLPAGSNALGSVSVSNLPATQPISATSLPLPGNAAQETGGNLASLNTKVTTTANGVKVDGSGVTQPVSGSVSVSSIPSITGTVAVSNLPATQAVSATSLPLPSNAAQETGGNLASLNTKVTATANGVKVDGSAVTQPVSGTVGVSSLPSVTGTVSVSNLPATQAVSGTVAVSSLPALPAGSNAIGSVSVSNLPATQPISATALPLPANAAQETGGNLATIATNIPAKGQATSSASTPVVLASDQSPLNIQGAQTTLTGNASALNASAITSTNVSTYENIELQITGTFSGTLSPQFSNDNTNWQAANLSPTNSSTVSPSQTINTVGNYNIPVVGIYFRVQMTAYTSGTASAVAWCSANAIHDLAQRAVSVTSGSITVPQLPVALGSQASSASLSVALPTDQTSVSPVPRGSRGLITTPAPQTVFKATFASAIASGVDTSTFTVIQTGTNQTLSQTGGNLLFTTGTTANAETIIRSNVSFFGSLIAKLQAILSQRIANNNFYFELVDIIGDSLAVTVNSATSITVTIPSNPFTSANVGQFVYVGAVQNISATAVPGRYAIASVSGNNVTFTVAGWPASGSGTCSLFGWNYHQLLYTGTTATNASYDTQRHGYNSGFTVATINTTASPGHLAVMMANDGNAYFADQLVASVAGTVQLTQRASRVVNLADESSTLYLQLRATNGSTAPASTTTWTLGTASVENYTPTAVVINDVKPLGPGNQMPVVVTNTPPVTISSGTVSTVSSVTSSNLAIPGLIADVGSAAITTTTTTATITPTFGSTYQVNIPVTVVSGTSPTLDVEVQESADGGTNWYAVYDFPRITAVGSYNSPVLSLTGNRVRYVQTVAGTTPSFTRAINRLQSSGTPNTFYRQIIDRTISLTTLSSTTVSLFAQGGQNAQLVVNIGAASGAPVLQLEGSDDAGATWYNIGSTLTAVANNTVQLTTTGIHTQFLRAIVTSAGSGVTAGYVLVRCY